MQGHVEKQAVFKIYLSIKKTMKNSSFYVKTGQINLSRGEKYLGRKLQSCS